jgi:hypothetical protein
MRGTLLLPAVAVCLGVTPSPAAARRAPEAAPVVVELFTAQGCTSCPDANRKVGKLADRKGVLVLTFAVDYWDYAGWRDTFAQPDFTARQHAYADRLKVREIYAPEVVVGGRAEAPGGRRGRGCASPAPGCGSSPARAWAGPMSGWCATTRRSGW